MPRTGWSPTTIPYGADQTVYLVIDRFSSGSVYGETEIERSDLETIISEFMTGQFNDPVRVVAFNTLEHWADDVSKDVAQEVQARCDIAGESVPEHLRDFVDAYTGPTRQLIRGRFECTAFRRKKRGSHRRQGGRAKQLIVKSNSRDVELRGVRSSSIALVSSALCAE